MENFFNQSRFNSLFPSWKEIRDLFIAGRLRLLTYQISPNPESTATTTTRGTLIAITRIL